MQGGAIRGNYRKIANAIDHRSLVVVPRVVCGLHGVPNELDMLYFRGVRGRSFDDAPVLPRLLKNLRYTGARRRREESNHALLSSVWKEVLLSACYLRVLRLAIHGVAYRNSLMKQVSPPLAGIPRVEIGRLDMGHRVTLANFECDTAE